LFIPIPVDKHNHENGQSIKQAQSRISAKAADEAKAEHLL